MASSESALAPLDAPTAGAQHSAVDRAVRNAFPIVVVMVLAMALSAVSPALFVGDSWMTLVAGREVWNSWIPTTETLTVMGAGAQWIDQQWFAQLVYYAADRAFGLAGVAALGVLVATSGLAIAVATARLLGASTRSIFLLAGVSFFIAPWAWQVRAQGLALPLFATVVLLTATHVRRPSKRLFAVLPVLIVWANVHGSVILGALIVSLAAAGVAITHRRDRSIWPWSIAVLPMAWLCALSTPYGLQIVDYYRLMLIDPPFDGLIVEWQRTHPSVITAVFYVVAVLTVFLVVRYRRRLNWFEIAVLALTLAGALQAVRGVVWFSVVVVAFLPRALDGVFRRRDVIAPRRANLLLLTLVGCAATVMFVANLARSDATFQETLPTEAVPILADVRAPDRVFATDRHADWVLWRLPELAGRVAFDVRFEVLRRQQVLSLARYTSEAGRHWLDVTDGYRLVMLEPSDDPSHLEELLAKPGAELVYRDDRLQLVRLP